MTGGSGSTLRFWTGIAPRVRGGFQFRRQGAASMTESQVASLREMVKQHGLAESRRVVGEYVGYRNGQGSELQEVTLEIFDAGSDDWNAHFLLNGGALAVNQSG